MSDNPAGKHKSKRKEHKDELHRRAIQIQSWWRMVAARLELTRRWMKAQEQDDYAESAWEKHSKKRIDGLARAKGQQKGMSPARQPATPHFLTIPLQGQFLEAGKQLQQYEFQGRSAVWQQYLQGLSDAIRYTQMMQYQTMVVYPRAILEQYELMIRHDILAEEFQAFFPLTEMQESYQRLLLEGEEVAQQQKEFAKLAKCWRQKIIHAPVAEMKARAALLKEENDAWALKLVTFHRTAKALQHLQDIEELVQAEEQSRERRCGREVQLRQELKEEEKACAAVCEQQAAEAVVNQFVEQQRQMINDEDSWRSLMFEELADDILLLVEEEESSMRTSAMMEEERVKQEMKDSEAMQMTELQTRNGLEQLQNTARAGLEKKAIEDRQRLDLWDQTILAEARARVGILFKERDDWFTALRAGLEGMETAQRATPLAEEVEERGLIKEEYDSFVWEASQKQERVDMEKEETDQRAVVKASEEHDWDYLMDMLDIHLADMGFRARVEAEEMSAWMDIEDIFHLHALQVVESLERFIILREEQLVSRFLWEKELLQCENITRNEIVGDEIRKWRPLSSTLAQEMAEGIQKYTEALAALHAEQRALFDIDEAEERQKIHNEQQACRRQLYEEEAEAHLQALLSEEARVEEEISVRDMQARKRNQQELLELQERQLIEEEEDAIFGFLEQIRKLMKLEDSMRSICEEEECRKYKHIRDHVEMLDIEVEETLARCPIQEEEQEADDTLQTFMVKHRAYSEHQALLRRTRLDHEEELSYVEESETVSRKRLEQLEHQSFNFIPLLAIERLEQMLREQTEFWEMQGRLQRKSLEKEERRELQDFEEMAGQQKSELLRKQAMERSRKEFLAEGQKAQYEQRMTLIDDEKRVRRIIVRAQREESCCFGINILEDKAVVSKQVLMRSLEPPYIEVMQRATLFTEYVKGALAIASEQASIWEMLDCQQEEVQQRTDFLKDEDSLRTKLHQFMGIGNEEDKARREIKDESTAKFSGIAQRFLAGLVYQSRDDLMRSALRAHEFVAKYEKEDWAEITTNFGLGVVEMEELHYRQKVLQTEHNAFVVSMHLPYTELNESAWRAVHSKTTSRSMTKLRKDVAEALAKEELWLKLRELQVEEAHGRRELGLDEFNRREGLASTCRAKAQAIREEEERRETLRKQQAMERLHFSIIERDARHSINHAEDSDWGTTQDNFAKGYQEIVDRMDAKALSELKRAKAKAEKAEKARKEAEARDARLAQLQADLNVSLVAMEEEPKRSSRRSSGMVTKKREAWASQSPAAPGGRNGLQDPHKSVRRSATGSPLSKILQDGREPLRLSSSGFPADVLPSTVHHLDTLAGQSLRSIYSYYCREYNVPTKPQILAALPKTIGDFSLKQICIGTSGSPVIATNAVIVRDVTLGDRGVLPILEVVKVCPSLHSLILRGCGIKGNVDAVVDVVVQHPSLTTLDLTDNPITSTGVQSLIHLAARNPRISSIQLDEELLAPTQQTDLSSSIGSNLGSRGHRLRPVNMMM